MKVAIIVLAAMLTLTETIAQPTTTQDARNVPRLGRRRPADDIVHRSKPDANAFVTLTGECQESPIWRHS